MAFYERALEYADKETVLMLVLRRYLTAEEEASRKVNCG